MERGRTMEMSPCPEHGDTVGHRGRGHPELRDHPTEEAGASRRKLVDACISARRLAAWGDVLGACLPVPPHLRAIRACAPARCTVVVLSTAGAGRPAQSRVFSRSSSFLGCRNRFLRRTTTV